MKPIFEDNGKGAPRSVLHMTSSRFRRGIKMFAPDLSIAKVDMLIEKFLDHDRLVNFAAFLAIIGAESRMVVISMATFASPLALRRCYGWRGLFSDEQLLLFCRPAVDRLRGECTAPRRRGVRMVARPCWRA